MVSREAGGRGHSEEDCVVPAEDRHRPSQQNRLTGFRQGEEGLDGGGTPSPQTRHWVGQSCAKGLPRKDTESTRSAIQNYKNFKKKKKTGESVWPPGLGQRLLTQLKHHPHKEKPVSWESALHLNEEPLLSETPAKVFLADDERPEYVNSQHSTVKTLSEPSRKRAKGPQI